MNSPAAHPFFTRVEIERLTSQDFDARLAQCPDQLVGIFFWGHDCPNCEVAKNMLSQDSEALNALGFKWFHVNVYEDFDLGTRFGLHGIPTFLFFHQGKKLGRISPFPGLDPFFEALRKLKAGLQTA
ncbi:MAG: thioredoxin family protein [Bdellovibrionaceae bacterium]|nr:thioredoxin family protein [Pseudobdellovibrionaceae bacterium]